MTAPNGNQRSGPCAGIRVLELATSMVSGPFCGQMLGDMGADVVKLEGPDGDVMRQVHPIKAGHSAQFMQFNRNKRSIAVDLKTAEGRATAEDLIRRADVVIENFRPGVTKRMGLDYEAAIAIRPDIVYVSINGFGSDGPYARLPAYDQVVQALTGFMPIQGSAEAPAAIRSVMVDKITALAATGATVAALLQRERTGAGQRTYVDDAVARVRLLRQLYLAGLTSTTIATLMPCVDSPSSASTRASVTVMQREHARLGEQIAELETTREQLAYLIAAATSCGQAQQIAGLTPTVRAAP